MSDSRALERAPLAAAVTRRNFPSEARLDPARAEMVRASRMLNFSGVLRQKFGNAYYQLQVPDQIVRATWDFQDLPRHLSLKLRAKMSFPSAPARADATSSWP